MSRRAGLRFTLPLLDGSSLQLTLHIHSMGAYGCTFPKFAFLYLLPAPRKSMQIETMIKLGRALNTLFLPWS